MLRAFASSLALLLSLPMIGCVAESGDPAPGSASDLAERLSEPVPLSIVPTEDGSSARVQAVTLRDGHVSDVELLVTGGGLTLSLDDAGLRVDSLEVQAADVSVGPAAMPPDGATLTGISVALSSPVAVTLASSSETAAASAGGLPVSLRWAVELDYGTVDLAPIRLPDLPFELSVELDAAGELEAHLTASQPGSFWNWAGIFELRNLELDLVAATGVPGPVD
jgi:hypothetical protein